MRYKIYVQVMMDLKLAVLFQVKPFDLPEITDTCVKPSFQLANALSTTQGNTVMIQQTKWPAKT